MALNRRILLLPHFPALLADSARGEEGRLQETMRAIGGDWVRGDVQVVVLLLAHWDPDGPFQVDNGARHKTLLEFEGVESTLHYNCDGWVELANALHENGIANGLPVETVHRGMDHSASVPMSYIFPDADRRVVPLSCSLRGREDYVLWGEVVRETCRGAGATVAIAAGGSLSYDPAAYRRGEDLPGGVDLDRRILGRLEAGDWGGLEPLSGGSEGSARPQAALRHLWFLRGVLGADVPGRVLAAQRHPSIGSAVVEFPLPD